MAYESIEITPENLAFALWAESYPIALKKKQIEVLWDLVLNPPASDPAWKGVHEFWLDKATRLIAVIKDHAPS